VENFTAISIGLKLAATIKVNTLYRFLVCNVVYSVQGMMQITVELRVAFLIWIFSFLNCDIVVLSVP